jgi:large subunit ribosomal protein L31
MREGIHPEYPPATVNCACGNTFVTRSTRGDFQVDVCAACHPFYTGTQKLIDAAGRVDRFNKRYGDAKKVDTKAAGQAAQEKALKDAAAAKAEREAKKAAEPAKPKKEKKAAAEAPAAEAAAAPAEGGETPAS